MFHQVDPCYEEGRARRCAPDFVNAAFGRHITATSTCGDAGRPSRYCEPSAAGTRRRSAAATSTSSCHVCDASDAKLRHPASYLTDLNNPNNVTCWVSEPAPPTASDNVSLTLSLGKKFEVVDSLCSPRAGVSTRVLTSP